MRPIRLTSLLAVAALSACGSQTSDKSAAPAEPTKVRAGADALDERARPVDPDRPVLAGTHCRDGEVVVYSCGFGRKTASVCSDGRTIAYRFGALGKPEIEIASDGADGRAHASRITAHTGRMAEDRLRFSRDGYQYVVYSGADEDYDSGDIQSWSGLAVAKDEKTVADLKCRAEGPQAHVYDPTGTPVTEEARGGPYDDVWYGGAD